MLLMTHSKRITKAVVVVGIFEVCLRKHRGKHVIKELIQSSDYEASKVLRGKLICLRFFSLARSEAGLGRYGS